MERHFTDGLKEITFADGTAKVILPNGEVQARVAPPDRVLRPALCCSLSLLPCAEFGRDGGRRRRRAGLVKSARARCLCSELN